MAGHLPAAGLVGGSCSGVGHGIGAVTAPLVGSIVIFSILVALSFYMWWRPSSRRSITPTSTRTGTPPPTGGTGDSRGTAAAQDPV